MNIFSMAYKLNLKVIAYFSSNLDGNINSCVKRFINLQSCNPLSQIMYVLLCFLTDYSHWNPAEHVCYCDCDKGFCKINLSVILCFVMRVNFFPHSNNISKYDKLSQ